MARIDKSDFIRKGSTAALCPDHIHGKGIMKVKDPDVFSPFSQQGDERPHSGRKVAQDLVLHPDYLIFCKTDLVVQVNKLKGLDIKR